MIRLAIFLEQRARAWKEITAPDPGGSLPGFVMPGTSWIPACPWEDGPLRIGSLISLQALVSGILLSGQGCSLLMSLIHWSARAPLRGDTGSLSFGRLSDEAVKLFYSVKRHEIYDSADTAFKFTACGKSGN